MGGIQNTVVNGLTRADPTAAIVLSRRDGGDASLTSNAYDGMQ